MSPCYSSINLFLYEVMMKRTKRKWSQSNLMVTIRILLNSYYGMFEFLGFARGIMDKSHQETAGRGKIKERCLIYRHL